MQKNSKFNLHKWFFLGKKQILLDNNKKNIP